MYNSAYDPHFTGGPMPGENNAIACLVLGILATAFCFFGYFSLLSLVLGIVGLVQASVARRRGYEGGIRTAGFILSLVGVILGGLVILLIFGGLALILAFLPF